MKPIQVYAVAGGCDYEGIGWDSLRLFDCPVAAEDYRESLHDKGYDYAVMDTRDLESAGTHSCLSDFSADYGHMEGERIDCGEFLVWLRY